MKESTKPKEKMERGQVKSHVYKTYIAAASTIGVIAFIVMNMSAQAFQIGGNLILRSWGEKNLEVGTTGESLSLLCFPDRLLNLPLVFHFSANIGLYLMFYGLSGLIASALNMGSSLLIWTYCAIRCSRELHDHSFSALMRSPMSFFETTVRPTLLSSTTVSLLTDGRCLPSWSSAPRTDPQPLLARHLRHRRGPGSHLLLVLPDAGQCWRCPVHRRHGRPHHPRRYHPHW